MACFLTISIKLPAKHHMVSVTVLFIFMWTHHTYFFFIYFSPFSVIDHFFSFLQKKKKKCLLQIFCLAVMPKTYTYTSTAVVYRSTRPFTGYLKYIQLYQFIIIFNNWFKKRLEIINWFATFESVRNNCLHAI